MSVVSPTDLDYLVQEDRVHRSIYVEPQIFAEEMTKVFGGTWVYLAHESELPNPHDFRTTRLGLRSVIVTRDAEGAVHALLNRCAHRGSIVCNDHRGNTKTFQCPYHGWSYRNTGELLGAPFKEGYPDGFFEQRRGLAKVARVATYRGFVFGTLNPDAPDLLDWLGPATEKLDLWIDRIPGGRVTVRNRHQLLYRGNWKLAWDNSSDGLHPTFVHRSLVMVNAERYGGGKQLDAFKQNPDDSGMFVEDLGNGHAFMDQRPVLRTYWQAQRPFPGSEVYREQLVHKYGDERAAELLEAVPASFMNVSIFPNLLIVANQLQIVEPLGVDQTKLSFYHTTADELPDEVNVMRMRVGEDFPSVGNTDDIEIFERCHEGLSIAEVEWIDMSKGLGTEFDVPDERGVRRTPVTYDIAMRGYLRAWKELMSRETELVAAAP